VKVAVFSDVQGNLPAMEAAVAHIEGWAPDLVVMAGDLINRGPSSGPCLARFQALQGKGGWLPVRGNHEDWVLHCGRRPPVTELEARMRRFADLAFSQIAGMAHGLADWPHHLCLGGRAAGDWVHVTHGTLAGNRDGISASVADADLHGRLPDDIALFVTAHTHKPLIRLYRGVTIVNVGSVGSPFDGDPRASYAQLERRDGRWRARIVRFGYDRAAAERDFSESGFIDEGGPLARVIFEEWRSARLLMPAWHRRYRSAVEHGEIGLERSVDEFLRWVRGDPGHAPAPP
jgi:predicted phosphodiesterase